MTIKSVIFSTFRITIGGKRKSSGRRSSVSQLENVIHSLFFALVLFCSPKHGRKAYILVFNSQHCLLFGDKMVGHIPHHWQNLDRYMFTVTNNRELKQT